MRSATFLYVILLITTTSANIRWLALHHHPSSTDPTPVTMCAKTYGLTYKQVRFCQSKFHWMRLIHTAATHAVDQCQLELGDRRWNCMSVLKAPSFGSDLKKDTREAAFVYALGAISVALEVTNGCMAGKVAECACRHPKRHVSFSSEIIDKSDMSNIDGLLGCKGILAFGQNFAKNFLGLGYRRKPRNSRQRREIAVNKHSVGLGLRLLDDGEEISCRCNGVTAGCAFQFCHRRIVPLKKAAAKLVAKYDSAVKISERAIVETIVSNAPTPNKLFLVRDEFRDKLVYLAEGPGHCGLEDRRVSRRQCVLDPTKTNHCGKLCCRGHQQRLIEVHSQCRCKFVYCCKVVCDTCKGFKTIYECL